MLRIAGERGWSRVLSGYRQNSAFIPRQASVIPNVRRIKRPSEIRSRGYKGDFMGSVIGKNRVIHSKRLTVLLAMTLAGVVSSLPAHAVTCEDVRGLSPALQDYWSKRLHLTAQERHIIWISCYQNYHPNVQMQVVRR
jgi:hypothetical protein